MLIDHTLLGTRDRVAEAIDIIQAVEPDEGYYLAFSGGKDSVVVKRLMEMAGVKFDAHYSLTTVDPPELVRFIREYHPDVDIRVPAKSMWQLILAHRFPPLRQQRYCCRELKEGGGSGRLVVTGVRWAESARRKERCITERDKKDATRDYLHPIIEWTDADVWQFIHEYDVPYCSLYDEGQKRLGCILCPMSSTRERRQDMQRWPKIAEAYRRVINKTYTLRVAEGRKATFRDGDELFEWWINDQPRGSDAQEHFAFD